MSSIALTPNAAGTAIFTVAAPGTSTNRTLTLPDATDTLAGIDAAQTLTNKTITGATISGGTISGTTISGSTIQGGSLTRDTVKTATGATVEFTGIPSWVKRVTVILNRVSTNGTSNLLVQIGSGSFTITGYEAGVTLGGGNGSSTIGFILSQTTAAAYSVSGSAVLTNITGNTWVSSGILAVAGSFCNVSGGSLPLGGVLDRVRVTTVNGTDLFDAGTINIMYEG
jgi:hypothetical protein